jgi:hypothetical protein
MTMRDWLWKVAEVISGVLFVLFILGPTRIELEFFRDLYDANPVYCVVLLTTIGVFIAVTLVHGGKDRRRKKASKDKAASSSGTP